MYQLRELSSTGPKNRPLITNDFLLEAHIKVSYLAKQF